MHRDLKPANILLSSSKKGQESDDFLVKLADFGFARYISMDIEEDIMDTRCGTPVYVAPEVNEGKYDSRADIYSVGCIFLELICGKFPTLEDQGGKQPGRAKKNFFDKFEKGQIDLSKLGIKISPLYLKLVKGMLVKDLNKRIDWS